MPILKSMVAAAALLSAFAAHSADYARERKWADEILPGLVVGDPVYLELASHRKFLTLFTPAGSGSSKGRAVIVVHGLGVHPDWGLIGVLRSALADAGYTTLSVQMPVLGNEARAEDYLPTYPEAAQRLAAAVAFLQAKGYPRIGLVSHSLGSRMSFAYLMEHPAAPVAAWVSMGNPANIDYRKVKPAVLDLYGENDFPDILGRAAERASSLKGKPGSKQIMAPGADHFFTGQDDAMVKHVRAFLDARL